MKKSKLFNLFIYIFSIFALSGCSLDALTSLLNKHHNDLELPSVDVNAELGNSLQLLDNAFNAKVDKDGNSLIDEFSNDKNDDFENAKRLNLNRNVHDLSYFDYLPPSTGKINGLVVPVEFPDARAKNVSSNDILPDYQSVSSYYYNSSYGQLDLTFDIVDWQLMPKKSSYYENMSSFSYSGDAPGASAIIDQVLSSLEKTMDLTKYDNDNDGVIDCLYIIYSTPIQSTSDLWWAFQYVVYETKTYDGLQAGYYVFAGYDFLFEDDKTCNTSSFIHESGHLFGLEDYYDYDQSQGYSKGALGGADMMDMNIGDHNPFSKLAIGWIKDPILVTLNKEEETVITIKDLYSSGDCIIFADNFDESKGIFQDYFILSLIDCDNILNKDQLPYTVDGIRVYRVHGELKNYSSGLDNYEYFKYDNSYTDYNLLDSINNNSIKQVYSYYEYMDLCASDSDLFITGDICNNLTYYDSIYGKCSYGFEVISIENNTAQIRIFRR